MKNFLLTSLLFAGCASAPLTPQLEIGDLLPTTNEGESVKWPIEHPANSEVLRCVARDINGSLEEKYESCRNEIVSGDVRHHNTNPVRATEVAICMRVVRTKQSWRGKLNQCRYDIGHDIDYTGSFGGYH